MRALRLRHPRLFAAAAAAATRHAADLHPMGLSHIIAACADLAVSDEALLDLAIRELEERAKRKEHLRVTTIMRAFTALAKVRRAFLSAVSAPEVQVAWQPPPSGSFALMSFALMFDLCPRCDE